MNSSFVSPADRPAHIFVRLAVVGLKGSEAGREGTRGESVMMMIESTDTVH